MDKRCTVFHKNNIDEYLLFVNSIAKTIAPDIKQDVTMLTIVTTYQTQSHWDLCRNNKIDSY